MIYLKRLWNILWFVIKCAILFVSFVPLAVIDFAIGPLAYYIVTGKNYFDLELMLFFTISHLFMKRDDQIETDETVLKIFMKEK